ncbi:MAG: YbcC family protein, partial [Flavisolibacter sp.]
MSTKNSAVVQAPEAGLVNSGLFQEKHILDELRHYLPTQTPLRDFIHHNSLHAFQDLKFYEALFKSSKIFGYQVTLQLQEYRAMYGTGRIRDNILERVIAERKGIDKLGLWKQHALSKEYDAAVMPRIGMLRAHWKKHYRIDLDNLVQPLLFRIIGSYLDQGIAQWKFPLAAGGFLASLKELEANSFSSFFRSGRVRELFLAGEYNMADLLWKLVGDEAHFEQYLFDQQFSHRGWSGMVATVEAAPHTLLDGRQVSLHDFIVFELLLEIDALDATLGKNWEPICTYVKSKPLDLFADIQHHEIHEVLKIWQDAFEWSYYDEVLKGIHEGMKHKEPLQASASFQAMFCIDERECSLRRHIEKVDPHCETLGTPGFFGVEFYFQAEHAQFYDKLCPAPVTPKYLVKENEVKGKRKHELLYTGSTHQFFAGTISTLSLGFWSAIRLFQNIFRPAMSPAISNAFAHMGDSGRLSIEHTNETGYENGLQVGFTIPEMTTRVEGLLRGIGLIKNFAPVIYAIAHGSSSANNPHHGAHDCGACSGRPGSVNSRVFAHMANHRAVRNLLREKGIDIPDSTQFVGGLHDTAADQVQFYDEEILSDANRKLHQVNKIAFEEALDLNAKERSRRFASINSKAGIKKIRKAILDRSVSMFEPRPELGHGTNTLCIIGRRELTKKLFLDRRAFLNSYDYRTDHEGSLLTGIMRPIGPVCGGINLEYYFSRVDNYKLGAGTKLPHNVMGLIGVANSSDGDLRPG